MSLPLKFCTMNLLMQFSCSFVFALCVVPEKKERMEKKRNGNSGSCVVGRNKQRRCWFFGFPMMKNLRFEILVSFLFVCFLAIGKETEGYCFSESSYFTCLSIFLFLV